MTELELKERVRQRDGYRCSECGMTQEEHKEKYGRRLEVHRLEPGSDYTEEGCATLCWPCHWTKPKSPYPTRIHYNGKVLTLYLPWEVFRELETHVDKLVPVQRRNSIIVQALIEYLKRKDGER